MPPKGEAQSKEMRKKLSLAKTEQWENESFRNKMISSQYRQDVKKRFWSKVDKKGSDECWEWTAGKTNGYGNFHIGRVKHKSHRLSFLWSGGQVTQKKPFVLHICDNPSCCNPKHLYAGNDYDNMQDMIIRKREYHPCGEKSGHHVLTENEVMGIKKLQGIYTQKIIGILFGVSETNISEIHRGKTWKNIGLSGV